jgi:hypothetical protein
MNNKFSRKQRLIEYHQTLARDNLKYRLAVLYDPNVKFYNKAQLKDIIKK